MSGPWSAEQREWLQALGLPALVLATGDGHDSAAAEASGGTVGAAGMTAAPAASGVGVNATGSAAGTPLHRALLKATGRTGAQADQMLRELGVGTGDRMDAAAKRALWTRLRQLRGGRPA